MVEERIIIRGDAQFEELFQALDAAGMKLGQFDRHLKKNFMQLTETGKVMNTVTQQTMRAGVVVNQAALKARRFKFEWLSIMFAGMALNRVFGGLVRTQMQLFGVTDMLGAAWTMVLLPIMELITPFLYKLLEVFMNLPEPVKLVIGAVVLLAAGLGVILMVAGQVMLALMGFSLLGISVGGLIAVVLKFSVVLGGIILIVRGIYNIFKGKFEGIGQIIMGVGIILLLFIGWWALIPIAVGLAVYLIIKHWDKIKAWFSKFWKWLKDIFRTGWEAIRNIFGKIGKFFSNVWNGIKSIFKGAINFILRGINFWIRGFESMINIAIKGINLLIRALNKVPGIDLGQIREIRLPRIPTFQAGGLVAKTGPALLHAGERVIPKNRVRTSVLFSPTINLNATITSEMDVKILANKLNEYWAKDFERFAQGRGLI